MYKNIKELSVIITAHSQRMLEESIPLFLGFKT